MSIIISVYYIVPQKTQSTQERRHVLKKIFSLCFIVCILLLSFTACKNEEAAYIGCFKTSEWSGDLLYSFTFSEDHSGAYKEYFIVGEKEFEQNTLSFTWRVKDGQLLLTFEDGKEENWYHSLKDDTLVIAVNGITKTFYRTDANGQIDFTVEPIE